MTNPYTLRGSPELDTQIDSELSRIAEAAAPHSHAGILLGGYGRGEGTPFIHPDGSQSPFNDYDLIVIVETLTPAVRQTFQRLEQKLSDELAFPVDLYPYQYSDLPAREFSLLNYEMKYGHQVVWGDGDILAAMPCYTHDAIPLVEGIRLLLNRGKLLLDLQCRLENPQPLTETERIRFIKFIFKNNLAFGDCALLAARQYDIFYAVKKTRIQTVGACPRREDVIAGYLKAIELKEWGDFQALKSFDIEKEFEATRSLYLHFLPWYQSQVPPLRHTLPSWIRKHLCTTLTQLLRGRPSLPRKMFYRAQGRFS